jgi:hypothetical protein
MPEIRGLVETNEQYLYKVQKREKTLEESYSRSMASSIIKGYVDDFFRKINVDDRAMVSQKGNMIKSNVNGLLDVMVQDNKAEITPNFKHKLYEFLSQNLRPVNQLDSQQFNSIQSSQYVVQPSIQRSIYEHQPSLINSVGQQAPLGVPINPSQNITSAYRRPYP